MKPDIFTIHRYEYQHLLNDNGELEEDRRRSALTTLHTEAVNRARNRMKPNRVLGIITTDISPSECDLPLHVCTQSYLARVDGPTQDVCPQCGTSGHTTRHLFSCGSNPTDQDMLSLWEEPTAAALYPSNNSNETRGYHHHHHHLGVPFLHLISAVRGSSLHNPLS